MDYQDRHEVFGVVTGFIIAGLILAIVTLLQGCAPTSSPMPTGSMIAPPSGAVAYCHRNPEDEKCRIKGVSSAHK